AVNAGSSIIHDISEVVQGPVPADEGQVWHGRDDRTVQFVAGDGVPGDRRAYAEFHFFAADRAVSAGNFDGCLYLLVLRPCTFENCGRIGVYVGARVDRAGAEGKAGGRLHIGPVKTRRSSIGP